MCMRERMACEHLQVPSPWGRCVLPVIQACNWSRPGSIVLLAGIHGGSDWPLAPGHCFWSYSTGFKKRWKLSVTRWMDAHQRECINQYAGEAVFFSPNTKSSSCILLVFRILCSPAVERRQVREVGVVRQPYHKQLWSTTPCHPVCDPRERCFWTLWWEFMENKSSSICNICSLQAFNHSKPWSLM